MKEELFTIGDVAKRLGVPQHRIAYLLQRNRAQESFRLAGRRIFNAADVDHIANELNQPHDAGRPPRRKESDET